MEVKKLSQQQQQKLSQRSLQNLKKSQQNLNKSLQNSREQSKSNSIANLLKQVADTTDSEFEGKPTEDLLLNKTAINESNTEELMKKKEDVKIEDSEEVDFNNRLKNLPLSFELLKNGLSCLGLCPNGLRNVYLRLSLPGANLTNINFLKNFVFLQNLDLSGNNIEDVSVLEFNKFLVQIDLSDNKLASILNLENGQPPYNLQELDLSRNYISDICSLEKLRFLKRLCLDYNDISKLDGFSSCKFLSHLSISHNKIGKIEGLNGLPLRYIDFRHNQISSLSGLSTLIKLEQLFLGNNNITSLQYDRLKNNFQPENHPYLRQLHLENNYLTESEELSVLTVLTYLRDVKLEGNPFTFEGTDYGEYGTTRRISVNTISDLETQNSVCQTFDAKPEERYKLHLFFLIPNLKILDGFEITAEEKVAALNRYNPPVEVIGSIRHACLMQREVKYLAKIKEKDIKSHKKPIIICGPNGVGKRTLRNKLMAEFPQVYGNAISHTTRKPRHGETNGIDYYFIQRHDFKKMNSENKFVEVVEMFGNMYGITYDSIKKVQEDGKICLIDLELEGVMNLKKSSLAPLCVYVTAPSMDILATRLQSKFSRGTVSSQNQLVHSNSNTDSEYIQQWLCQAKINQLDINSEINSMFDLKLVNDDLSVCYNELKKQLVKWYWESYGKDK
ncbi:guanylate kinase [Lobulomyces angularis]|nr:guanylate kinase [Lobulomyces angularis]